MKKLIRRENGSTKVITINSEPSRTSQSEKDQTDINKIMKKYHQTGLLPQFRQKVGTYGDFSQAKTYQQSLDAILTAQAEFMTLPSELRKKFNNDPGELLQFIQNPENTEEGIKLGLFNPPQETQTQITETKTPETKTPETKTPNTKQNTKTPNDPS
nr:MAG: internal scaffolding protein [Microvirus sp.]